MKIINKFVEYRRLWWALVMVAIILLIFTGWAILYLIIVPYFLMCLALALRSYKQNPNRYTALDILFYLVLVLFVLMNIQYYF